LSKEEESQTTDAEVTREDQDKINRFSALHNKSKILEVEIEAKKVRACSSFFLLFRTAFVMVRL
jgi:hypothetical protein